MSVPVLRAEVPMKCKMQSNIYSFEHGYKMDSEQYLVEDGEVVLNMGKYSAVVMTYKS